MSALTQPIQKPNIPKQFYLLIIYIRLLHMGYHHAHVHSNGLNYFSDHKLFEHLYHDIASESELDKVMEKFKGLVPDIVISLPEILRGIQVVMEEPFQSKIAGKAMKVADGFQSVTNMAITAEILLNVEHGLQEHLTDMIALCETESNPNIQGLVNMLQDIADKHQEAIYHLGQRLKI